MAIKYQSYYSKKCIFSHKNEKYVFFSQLLPAVSARHTIVMSITITIE